MNKETKKVLVVEDDKDFLWLLKESFNHQGLDMAYAKDGAEGLELAQTKNPDLIIADILMPGMDGIEMVKQIKEKGVSSKIIFLTNFDDPSHIGQAIDLGADIDYIVKADMHITDIVSRAKEKLGVK